MADLKFGISPLPRWIPGSSRKIRQTHHDCTACSRIALPSKCPGVEGGLVVFKGVVAGQGEQAVFFVAHREADGGALVLVEGAAFGPDEESGLPSRGEGW